MAASLLRKVNAALRKKLTDYDSGLEYVRETRRVMGFVISSDFKAPDYAKRQRLLKRAMKDDLSDEEMSRVGPIVPMSPTEARLQDDDARTPPRRKPKPHRN